MACATAQLSSSPIIAERRRRNLGMDGKLKGASNCTITRIHGSWRVTPAMEAGVADHIWILEEVFALLN
jgi:hypothetical protein